MINLQDLFKNAENNVQSRLDGLPIFGSYKAVLSQIINIDEQVFEMLYDEDTENSSEYNITHVDLLAVYDRLKQFQ